MKTLQLSAHGLRKNSRKDYGGFFGDVRSLDRYITSKEVFSQNAIIIFFADELLEIYPNLHAKVVSSKSKHEREKKAQIGGENAEESKILCWISSKLGNRWVIHVV